MAEFYRFASENPILVFLLALLLFYVFTWTCNTLITLVRGRKPECYCPNCQCAACCKHRKDEQEE